MKEFTKWTTYQRAYTRAFEEMLKQRRKRRLDTEWETGTDVFHWWMEDGVIPGQIEMEEF